jgi:predicted PurR-regulated permease PerM
MQIDWTGKQIARAVLIVAVAAASVWMLRQLLPALAWAVVLAIGTWPLRQWLIRKKIGQTTVATLLTLLLAVAVVLPLIRIGVEAAHDGTAMANWVSDVIKNGFPGPPGWLEHLPYHDKAQDWWQAHLTKKSPADLLTLLGISPQTAASYVNPGSMLDATRVVGTEVAGRLTVLVFTLVTLFFLYRDGEYLMEQAQALAGRLFGPVGWHHGENALAAVRGSVNGLVFVGMAEGVLLGLAYCAAGLPYATSLGLLTAVFSTLPLGAPLVFCACALALFLMGKATAAVVLAIFGFIVMLVADNVVRPKLISRETSLPFLAVLLGIVGGLETFSLLGLFLGPALIAVLVAMWREGVDPDTA